jgi:hypothetical protein
MDRQSKEHNKCTQTREPRRNSKFKRCLRNNSKIQIALLVLWVTLLGLTQKTLAEVQEKKDSFLEARFSELSSHAIERPLQDRLENSYGSNIDSS